MSWRQLDLLNSQFKNGEVVEVKWGKEWLEAKVIEGRKGGTYEVKFMADDFRKIASKNEIRKGILTYLTSEGQLPLFLSRLLSIQGVLTTYTPYMLLTATLYNIVVVVARFQDENATVVKPCTIRTCSNQMCIGFFT